MSEAERAARRRETASRSRNNQTATTEETQPVVFPFMRLPPELRLMVYRYAFAPRWRWRTCGPIKARPNNIEAVFVFRNPRNEATDPCYRRWAADEPCQNLCLALPDMQTEMMREFYRGRAYYLELWGLTEGNLDAFEECINHVLSEGWAGCQFRQLTIDMPRKLVTITRLRPLLVRLVILLHRFITQYTGPKSEQLVDVGDEISDRPRGFLAMFEAFRLLSVRFDDGDYQDEFFIDREVRTILETNDIWTQYKEDEDIDPEEEWFEEYRLLFKTEDKRKSRTMTTKTKDAEICWMPTDTEDPECQLPQPSPQKSILAHPPERGHMLPVDLFNFEEFFGSVKLPENNDDHWDQIMQGFQIVAPGQGMGQG